MWPFIEKYRKQWFSGLILCIALVFFIYFNQYYFIFSFQIILGLCVLPFLIRPDVRIKRRPLYLYLGIVFFVLAMGFHLQIFLFAAWSCLLLFLIEWYWGELGLIPLFFIGAVSPALYYVIQIFSFPIRLQLSGVTCYLFQMIGWAVENKGSYFLLPDGQSFQVDQACVGLKMVGTGYIAAVLILAQKEKLSAMRFPFWKLAVFFSGISLLLIFSNLLRIMALVLFHSMPDTISHELIGMGALTLYAVLPFYFWVRFWVNKPKEIKQYKKEFSKGMQLVLPALALVTCITGSFAFRVNREWSRKDDALQQLTLSGFTKKEKEDGVMEFRNDSILLYIKPSVQIFEGGHPPQICWRASGFELSNFEERNLGNWSMMFGVLRKGDAIQYTAWWYENDRLRTVKEWDWRRSSGNAFRIINANAKDSAQLIHWLNQYRDHPILSVSNNVN